MISSTDRASIFSPLCTLHPPIRSRTPTTTPAEDGSWRRDTPKISPRRQWRVADRNNRHRIGNCRSDTPMPVSRQSAIPEPRPRRRDRPRREVVLQAPRLLLTVVRQHDLQRRDFCPRRQDQDCRGPPAPSSDPLFAASDSAHDLLHLGGGAPALVYCSQTAPVVPTSVPTRPVPARPLLPHLPRPPAPPTTR